MDVLLSRGDGGPRRDHLRVDRSGQLHRGFGLLEALLGRDVATGRRWDCRSVVVAPVPTALNLASSALNGEPIGIEDEDVAY
jgi:hypothetical protein